MPIEFCGIPLCCCVFDAPCFHFAPCWGVWDPCCCFPFIVCSAAIGGPRLRDEFKSRMVGGGGELSAESFVIEEGQNYEGGDGKGGVRHRRAVEESRQKSLFEEDLQGDEE